MSTPDLALPDDVDALKAMVVAMAEKAAGLEERNADLEAHNTHLELVNKSAEERIARLTAVVKMLERSRFGSRSERLRAGALSEEQYALVFDEIETGVAAIQAQMEKSAGGSKAKRAPRPRKGFAAHLERIEVVIEPETPAGCEALEKILIGEDVSERLDVTPAKF
ncbi:IS66 family transposase, partial [Mesorhizobium sp. M0933]